MPKHAIDYQKAKIYKLCCNDVDVKDVYVGSTTNITRRKSSHKCACNNVGDKAHHLNVYSFIRENDGWDNWSMMIVIEEFPCDSNTQLHTRERFHIENLHATLNKQIPTRARKEWFVDNSEQVKARMQEYHKNNSEKTEPG